MDIVFTIDEKFTRFCAVAIASLFKHNKTEETQRQISKNMFPHSDR